MAEQRDVKVLKGQACASCKYKLIRLAKLCPGTILILRMEVPNAAGSDRRQSAYNSGLLGSSTLSTESTAMGDSRDEYCDTTLLLRDLQCMQIPSVACSPKHGAINLSFSLRSPPSSLSICGAGPSRSFMLQPQVSGSAHVLAAFMSDSLSLRSTGMATFCRISEAFSAAVANESDITVGWTPLSRSSRHLRSSAPQTTVTDVVPSPAATSCTSTDAIAVASLSVPAPESPGCL